MVAHAPASVGRVEPAEQLGYLDQAMYLGLRATGQAAVMQCSWIYEHPVDMDGLRRFHRNFGYGLAGRRIERSPLPFGRHRWVRSLGPMTDIDIAAHARPRAELGAWLDERAVLPVDPERGPGWHLAVMPMTDGSTAVTLVGSHCLGDGGGALMTVYNAVTGNHRDLGFPPPRSRTRRRALIEDSRQVARDLPEVWRTAAAAARLALQRRKESTPGARSGAGAEFDDIRHVPVPAVTAFVDLAAWDACADTLRGNSYSLLAGFAAVLARSMNRTGADGTVAFIVPINDRTGFDDTRANAVKLANVAIDPVGVTHDLSTARAAIKVALGALQHTDDPALALLPLVPFMPKRAVRHAAEMAFGFADQPVSCSNLGDVPVEVGRVDGTDAEYVMMRGVDQHVTRRVLEQRRGLLTVVGARIGSRLSIAVIGYQGGQVDSTPELRGLVERALSEFGLDAVVI